MSGSVNRVILIGNLGKDPEVRNTQSGAKIVSFSLATSETWNDRASGEKRERTEWHRVSIFNERLADVAERFLRKGRKIYLEGSLQTRKWTGQDGKENYTTEVVIAAYRGELILLDSRQDSQSGNAPYGGGYGQRQSQQAGRPSDEGYKPGQDLDDQIPF